QHDIPIFNFNTEYQKLSGINCKAFALCFDRPSRVNGDNSITSAITYGHQQNPSANASHAGKRWAVMVYNNELIARAAAATGEQPKGTIYTLLANDQPGPNGPARGEARAPQVTGAALTNLRAQMPAGVKVETIDQR